MSLSADNAEWLIHQSYTAHLNRNYSAQLEFANKALQVEPSSHVASALAFLAMWEAGDLDKATIKFFERAKTFPPKGFDIFCSILAHLRSGAAPTHLQPLVNSWLNIVKYDARADDEAYRQGAEVKILRRGSLAEISSVKGEMIQERFGLVENVRSQSKHMMNRWSYPSFHLVEDVMVMPKEWYVFNETNIYIDETVSWPDKWSELSLFHAKKKPSPSFVASSGNKILLNVPEHKNEIDEPCILLGSEPNFYFWLAENLARLATIEGIYDIRAHKMLVDENVSEMHLDALNHLGIPPENIVRCSWKAIYSCKQLVVPGVLLSVDVLHKKGVMWLRDRFRPKSRDTSYPSKIFISRSKAHRRPFINEPEIEEYLKKNGYVTIVPDSLSFMDQIEIVQNADFIVSPYGTCLTVLLFAPETCCIFELIDEMSVPIHRFKENLANQIGQKFRCIYVDAHRDMTSESVSEGGFTISPESLRAQMNA